MRPISFLLRFTAGLLVIASATLAAQSQPASNVVVGQQAQPILLRMHRGALTASFTLAGDAKIHLGANTKASLTDLKVGQTARITYTVENGVWLAHIIVVNPPHVSHATSGSAGVSSNELHAHGAILSYNASTGIVTTRYHR